MKPIRVLLVDDHPVVRAGIEGILNSQTDIEVVGEASDGIEAICLNQTLQPDVILMDLQMPEMDGFQCTRAIRSSPGAISRIPIVAMTAHAMETDRIMCLDAGMDGYVTKPIMRDDLFETLSRIPRSVDPEPPLTTACTPA